jgi:two-component system NtrC family sensor kinase
VGNYAQDLLSLISLYREHYAQPVPAIQEKSEEIDLEFLLQDFPQPLKSIALGTEFIMELPLTVTGMS